MNDMDTLEIKNDLLVLISRINDKDILTDIYAYMSSLLQESDVDFWDELDTYTQAEIAQALAESENEENLIPHEEVMKMYL
ncbi:MAG: hypothetical protein EAZ08_12270 [Cytophagales bacterium]|nr:MAG: hypothetical protein EAZ08_12270 [Cytophagales bacterium]